MTTLASQMVTVGVGLGGAAAISLVVSVVTARLLGVEQFGLYGFAFAYVALWGVFMDAGGTVLASREVARGHAAGVLRLLLAAKVPLVAVALMLALLVGAVSGFDRRGLALVAVLAIGSGIDTCFGIARGVFRGRREFGVDALQQMAQRALFGVLAITALLAGGGVLSVGGARALSLGAATIAAVLLLRRRGELTDLGLRLGPRRDIAALIIPAGSLMIVDLVTQIQLRSGIVVLRYMRDLTEVGLYTAPARLLEGLALLPTAIGVALLPRLVGAQRSGGGDATDEVRLALRFTAVLGTAILVAGVPWASEVTAMLFGPAYAGSATPLRVLLIVQLLMMVNAVLRSTLIASGAERACAAIIAAAGIAGVLAALVLTPRWGATGAAASALVAELTLMALGAQRFPAALPLRQWTMVAAAGLAGLAAISAAKGLGTAAAVVVTIVIVTVGFEALSPLPLREFLPGRGRPRPLVR